MKIIITFFLFCVSISWVFAWDLRDQLNPISWVGEQNPVLAQAAGGAISGDESILTGLFQYVRDFIFDILWLIAVGVFLYFWFKLISAQWNPEELKKVLVWFVYAVIGLAIIPLSWTLVRLISSLEF